MSYKTIVVHVDDDPRAAARVGAAADLARRFEAHLVGVALTGVARFLHQGMLPADNAPTLALHLQFLRERANTALAAFGRQLDGTAVASSEARLVDDEAGSGISLQARVADLVVLGQAEPDQSDDLPAYVVQHAARPVLVLPYAAVPAGAIGRQVLLAWDASEPAARALLFALPFLRAAQQVRVAVFERGAGQRTTADAVMADPLPFLARHEVTAELSTHAVGARRGPHRRHLVGEALLSLATDISADLLVMGAYGHSRVRETMLGGVTRTILEAMTIPVLMAH